MLTYLQHTDPTIPYYRRSQWTFVRGALSAVDRPFLGWIGRVFFHNVSHNHVCRNFLLELHSLTNRRLLDFASPFLFGTILWVEFLVISTPYLHRNIRADNQPVATECIKKVLKEDYNYDSTVSITWFAPKRLSWYCTFSLPSELFTGRFLNVSS